MAATDNDSGGTDTKDDNIEEITSTTTATTEMDGSIEVDDDDIPIESDNIDSSTDTVGSSSEQSIQVQDITNENKVQTNTDVENNQSTNIDIDGDTIVQSTATETVIPHNNKDSEVILLDMDGTIIDNSDTDEDYNDIENEVVENEEQTLNVDGSTANVDDTVQSTSGDSAKRISAEEMTDNISTDEPANNNKEKEKKLIILPSFGDDPIIDYPPPQQVVTKSNDEEEAEEKTDTQGSVNEQVSSDSSTSDEDESPADRTTSSDESQSNATDNDETDASNTTKEDDESTPTESEDNSTSATAEEIEDDGPRQIKQVDYASKAAGAIILENSPSLEGASNLLTSDKDKYSIAPCADKKYVVISLSEDILVKQIKLSNYERYSSRVKEFQVLSSQEYPSTGGNSNDNSEETPEKDVWNTIGTYTVHSKSGEQTFELEEPSWARYLKFRFISHWGSEHYCTLSQIKVHGSTMLQGFHEQWIESEIKINEEQEIKEEEEMVDELAEGEKQQEEEVSDEEDGDLDTAADDPHVEVGETDDTGDDLEQNGEQSSETMETDEQIRTKSGEAEQLEFPDDNGDSVDTEDIIDSPPVAGNDDNSEVPQNIESKDERPDVAKGEKIVKDTYDETKSATPTDGSDKSNGEDDVDEQASDEVNSDGEEQEHLTEQEEELSKDDASSSSSHIDTPDAINEDDLPKSSHMEEEGNQQVSMDDGDDHVKDESSISAAVTDASVTEESKDVIVGDENPSDSDEELDQAIQSKATETTKSHDTTTTNTDDPQPDTSAGEKSQSKGKLSTNNAEQKGDDSTVVKGSVAKVDTTSKETSKPVKKNIQKEKLKTAATKGGDMLKREAITHPSKDLGASVGELYAKLIRRFPHAKCLKDLDLQAFKSKSLLANAERSGGSSVGGGAPKMEPIFAKITNEIKSVQLQQTQYEQYISALKTCYESVFLDVAKDLDSTKGTDVEQRLASLERAVFLSEMTSKGGRSSYPSSHGLSSFFPTFPPFKVSPFQFSVPIYTMPTLEDHSTVIIGSLTAFLLATWLLLLRRKRKGGSTNVSRENTQHDVTLKKDKINGISNPNNILENELAETKNKLLDSDKKFRGLNSQHTSLQEEHEQLKQRYSQLEQTVRNMENEAEHMTPRRNNINVIPNENGHSSDVNTPTHSTSLPSSPSNKEE